jgi:hypothetical protein
MPESREHTLATNLIARIKSELEEALADEDYTRVVEVADNLLGEDDEEANELFNLVDDGSSDDDELSDDFDDLDEDFDDEEDDEEDGYLEDFDEEDEEDDDEE